jgi:2'-5' RNA ligase
MNLPDYYDAMRQKAFRQLSQGRAELDSHLDSEHDDRRGLTLLARPPAAVTARIEALLADFQRLEPEQYYYPATDIHLTILAVISCYAGFRLAQIDPAEYREAVREILRPVRPFTIRFAGLTASPGGIIVQGFPQDKGLNDVRAKVREFFRHSSLPQSVDQRYSIQTAHATVVRFRRPVQNPRALLEMISKYEQYFMGVFEVDTVELVYNDWYQRAANTVLLEKYWLRSE